PGAAAVLADPDLLAELVADDARSHGGGRREIGRAVAAYEQDARFDRRPLVRAKTVDEQPLAHMDAVLLTAQTDDRVGAHGVETRALRPRLGSVANGSFPVRRPIRTWVRTRSPPSRRPAPRAAPLSRWTRQWARHRSGSPLPASSSGCARHGIRGVSSSWVLAPPRHQPQPPRSAARRPRPARGRFPARLARQRRRGRDPRRGCGS